MIEAAATIYVFKEVFGFAILGAIVLGVGLMIWASRQ